MSPILDIIRFLRSETLRAVQLQSGEAIAVAVFAANQRGARRGTIAAERTSPARANRRQCAACGPGLEAVHSPPLPTHRTRANATYVWTSSHHKIGRRAIHGRAALLRLDCPGRPGVSVKKFPLKQVPERLVVDRVVELHLGAFDDAAQLPRRAVGDGLFQVRVAALYVRTQNLSNPA
jgi:hypothetical protein